MTPHIPYNGNLPPGVRPEDVGRDDEEEIEEGEKDISPWDRELGELEDRARERQLDREFFPPNR